MMSHLHEKMNRGVRGVQSYDGMYETTLADYPSIALE